LHCVCYYHLECAVISQIAVRERLRGFWLMCQIVVCIALSYEKKTALTVVVDVQ
jgi:hypothetical protein